MPDLDVIRRVREGDTELFRVIVVRYQNRLFSTARRHSRREEEVQDIVQEVFAKAFHRLNSFRGDEPFEHWLMRLAIHTCYDFLREHQRNRELHEVPRDHDHEDRGHGEEGTEGDDSISLQRLADRGSRRALHPTTSAPLWQTPCCKPGLITEQLFGVVWRAFCRITRRPPRWMD